MTAEAPEWVRSAVFWHLHPLRFVDAPPDIPPRTDPVPRLRSLLPWIDYAVELGANGLLLGPIFASETHGYDTTDHYRIDPRLGTAEDLVQLLDEAHAKGVRVVVDGVFNHVGRGFGPFAEATATGPSSRFFDWFRWDEQGQPAVFEGHERLVALNHRNPAVVDYVVDVMRHWSRLGVDGWRLDAAYAVPTSFWAEVSARITGEFPDMWLVGEAIHGDYAHMVTQADLHSVTQYELWKAIWSSLNDRNYFELAHALKRHDALLEVFVPQTFVGNHDVTRIASRLADRRHLAHAVVVLCTVGGVPSVYAGDEHGFVGIKEERPGGDDAIRPAFPAHPDQLGTEDRFVLPLHQELIGLRRRHPWLHRAQISVEHLTNTALAYRCAAQPGTGLLVALNIGGDAMTFDVPSGQWRLEAGHAALSAASATVPGHGWAVLSPNHQEGEKR